ncbi:hypothetical protein ABPG77_003663 [Micractinium sp. CCAP 211/92]
MLRVAVHRASRRAALDCRHALATQPQSTGPGLPRDTVSREEADRMDQRLYQGDKVEDAPKPKSFKPDQEQPVGEDMNKGTGSERVQTPASPGRPQDTSEPIGGPM